jgi:hypothetical protein
MNFILRLQPPPPIRKTTGSSGWGGFRKLFGLSCIKRNQYLQLIIIDLK